ncbi:MAG: methylated-DNA--[protein]-cysteine S-methyltransferase [Pseudomonadota bacterium]
MTSYALFSTPIGPCGIAWRGGAVVGATLPEGSAEATGRRIATRSAGQEDEPPPAIREAMDLIVALLEGEKVDLGAISCDLDGVEPFAQEVYRIARSIAPGQTTTYGAIAEDLGDKLLARNVGQALGRNPIPIIVPCHRVLGADGKLVGFSANGGVALKLRMLAIEGAQPGRAPGLFDDLPLSVKPAP